MSSKRFFFLLSGENPSLATYELECLVHLLIDSPFRIQISQDNRVFELILSLGAKPKLDMSFLNEIMDRVTLAHYCCERLFQIDYCSTSIPQSGEELVAAIPQTIFHKMDPERTFAVTTKRIGNPIGPCRDRGFTLEISGLVGNIIQELNPGKQVNLDVPMEQIIILVSKHGMWLGKYLRDSFRKKVRLRSAHSRPFFHPSAMNPILQRTMINLASLKPGDWMLDPFCGTGGALLEGARLGIRSVGVEIDRRIIWGARQNLQSDVQTKSFTHLIFADGIRLGIKGGAIDGVVTDPPYGSAASTKGRGLDELLIELFREIRPFLRPQCRVVVATPSSLEIEQQAAQILNATYKTFFQYIHKSLTRKILVFILNKP
ncbi:MAG: DNA methyltransferase [Candidatus Heimdallarchaeota archaeon]